MRTLTEKYNAVLEGTFPKKQFVRDARLAHPTFITQFNSYEDAVKILKGKGLLYENGKKQITQESSNTYTSLQVIAMAKRAGEYVLDARDSLRELVIGYGDSIPKQEVLQVLSQYDLELEDVTEKPSFGTHPTDGSPTDTEMPSWMLEAKKDTTFIQNLPPTTLDKAIRYELEKAGVDYLMAAPDTEDYLKARTKAEKALAKDRLYYLNLEKSRKKRTDLMEPVTTKNLVDKGNEMKKAKLKEAVKFLIKSILK